MAQADLETFSFHNTDGPKGWQGFSVEWQRGVIRGEAEGFWSLPMTEQHVAAWIKCVRRIHSEGRPVRVIADLRRAQTQSQEVASTVQSQVAGLYREGDRIAVIVKASLLKTQLRRVLNSDRAMYFPDADEGERWVLSDGLNGGSHSAVILNDSPNLKPIAGRHGGAKLSPALLNPPWLRVG